jgi:hypothetical protein
MQCKARGLRVITVCVYTSTNRFGHHRDMGKLNIAHHKSYHPYRRDNIERVRRDEEEARQKETVEEGKMMTAVGRQAFTLLVDVFTSMHVAGLRGSHGAVAAACHVCQV